jgi:hypothetical protein
LVEREVSIGGEGLALNDGKRGGRVDLPRVVAIHPRALPMGRDYIVSAFSRLREAVEDRDVPSDSGHGYSPGLGGG